MGPAKRFQHFGNVFRDALESDGNCLTFGVCFDTLFAQLTTVAAHLETAEWSGSIEDVVAVHPDGARPNTRGEVVGL